MAAVAGRSSQSLDRMAKSDHSGEFLDRRSRMWRAATIPMALASIGGLCALGIGAVDAESAGTTWVLMLASILALVAGLAGIVIAIGRFIKCPSCGKVPTDEGAVDLFPKRCPNCGTNLA